VGVVQMPEAPYFVVLGEEPRSFAMAHYRLLAGQPITGKKQILLGKLTAKNFKKEIGQTFRLNEATYRVAGIYETGVNFEDGGAVLSLADAQSAFDKRHQVSYYKLKLKQIQRMDEIKEEIESRWPELIVSRSGEPTKQDEIFDLYRSLGWFLGIFAILVGGLGMMNANLMSVFERTREIGILRALGWRRRRIIGLILGESLVIALAGGLLGMGLGVGLTSLARLSPAVASMLEGVFTPAIFWQAWLTSLLLGVVGGLYPAWRAARLTPIEAMRAESGVEVRWGKRTQAIVQLLNSNAWRNLWRRPIRTLMTMLGLGIGSGFIVVLIAVTEGVTVTFVQLLGAGQADLAAEQANASDASFSVIEERTADQLEARPEVKSVSKMLFGVSTAPGLPYFFILGLDPHEEYIKHYQIQAGRLMERPGEIILGRLAASGLEKNVGDKVRVAGTSYRVVGVYENGLAYEDMAGVIMLREAQKIFNKPRQVSFLGIQLHDPAQAEIIGQKLEADFPEVIISQPAALTERMQDFATMDAIFNALIWLTIVVGGIVMMNVMMMSVFERTQEIGILRALGWKRRRVLGLVLNEALWLSFLSAVSGMALGAGLSYLLTLEPTYGDMLKPAYSFNLLLQVLLLALGLGVLGGGYPAWRAASLRPIEALRYE